jgi:streptogramin lyase
MISFAGFNICMILVLFVAAKLRHAKARLWVRGLSLAASATFLIGLLISPVSAAMITEYWYGPNPARPWEIACDTSANQAFYTAQMSNRIGLVQWGASKFYEWNIPTDGANPWGIALGPEIATDQGTFVWFTEAARAKIARLNPITGEFVEWPTLTAASEPLDIVIDRSRLIVYFTEFNAKKIGKLFYVGGVGWRMFEYALPAGSGNPRHIALDNDGIVWFTAPGGTYEVGRFNPFKGGGAGGEFTMYSVPSSPNGITVDKDGFVWFTSWSTWSICRLDWWKNQTNSWVIPSTGCNPAEIVIDQDGSVFFTEFATAKIGKFVPGTGDFYEYPTPSAGSQPYGICIHSPGVIVFTEAQTNRLGRLFQPANVGGGDTKTTTVNWVSHASTSTSAATTICTTTTIAPTTTTITTSVAYTTSTESAWSTTQSTITETKSILYTSSTSTSTQTSTSTTVTSTTTSTTTTKTSTSTETSTTTTTSSTTSTSTTTETSSSTTTVTYPTTEYFPTITSIAVVSWTSTSTSTIATTSQTTETTRVTVVTTYRTTVTSTPTTRQCIIASAAHGSELAPDVQFLRMFRDLSVQTTFAGGSFMNVFNAFYYSFSTSVASTIIQYPLLQSFVKILIYPLVGSLRLASAGSCALGFAPELAVISSGLLASVMIGIVYLTPIITVASLLSKRTRRRC